MRIFRDIFYVMNKLKWLKLLRNMQILLVNSVARNTNLSRYFTRSIKRIMRFLLQHRSLSQLCAKLPNLSYSLCRCEETIIRAGNSSTGISSKCNINIIQSNGKIKRKITIGNARLFVISVSYRKISNL